MEEEEKRTGLYVRIRRDRLPERHAWRAGEVEEKEKKNEEVMEGVKEMEEEEENPQFFPQDMTMETREEKNEDKLEEVTKELTEEVDDEHGEVASILLDIQDGKGDVDKVDEVGGLAAIQVLGALDEKRKSWRTEGGEEEVKWVQELSNWMLNKASRLWTKRTKKKYAR